MKKFTKWLALLMAGLVLSATLVACDDGYDWAEDDDDDDEEQSDSDPNSDFSSKFENLTPEEILNELLETKDFTIEMKGVSSIIASPSVVTYTICKNGGKLRISMISQTDYKVERKAYFDLDEHIAYEEEDNGEWIYQKQEDLELSDLLGDLIPVDLLFDKDSYETYDPENGQFIMKPEVVSDEMTGSEEVTGKGEMTSQEGTYTFTFSVEQGTKKIEYTLTVTFTSDTVTLPDAKPFENKGTAVPDVEEQ